MVIVLLKKGTNDIINVYRNVTSVTDRIIESPYGKIVGINRDAMTVLQMINDPGWQTEADYRVFYPDRYLDEETGEVVQLDTGEYHGVNDDAIAWIQNEISLGNYKEV